MNRTWSLGTRLFLAAALFITIALASVAVVTNIILDRFVHRQIDQQLDAQIAALQSALVVDPSGHISIRQPVISPQFDRAMSGWYWEVIGSHNLLRSPSLGDHALRVPPRPAPPAPESGSAPLPGDGPGPADEGLHFRVRTLRVDAQPVTVTATAPDDAFIGPLHQAMTGVLLALSLAALALLAAMYLQVRLGLQPLRKLVGSVIAIRTGKADRLPDDQPSEIAPLTNELNKLLAENAENLLRARRHVSNLAHGLKTPLANLSTALQVANRDTDGELTGLVDLMDKRIRHHLSRARVAAIEGPARTRTLVAQRAFDISDALRKIYADRHLDVLVDIAPEIAVACEAQDLDEILGNLLDNAFKWAKSEVRITGRMENARVAIAIDDDGAGLSADKMESVLRPGTRLDEAAPGYGFGLPIARELVELYGGTLSLQPGCLGGLHLAVHLPAAI